MRTLRPPGSIALALALVAAMAGLAHAEPPTPRPTQALLGCKVPGRKADSQIPWELFLGNASHRLIAYIYGTRYPTNKVYYNKDSIKSILRDRALGDWSLLSADERELRPDITDTTTQELFEIKPHGEKGLRDGLQEVQTYLLALNKTLRVSDRFSAGKDFEGELLIQFTQGQHIWRLEWCTTTPGVTQYRWTRSQERFDSAPAAYQAERWMEISEQELKQYGGWVAQAAEGMVDRRERLATFSGAVGVAIDVVGQVAMIVISTARPGERSTSQPGGKVLPFP